MPRIADSHSGYRKEFPDHHQQVKMEFVLNFL